MEASRKEQLFIVTSVAVLMLGGVAFAVSQFFYMGKSAPLPQATAPVARSSNGMPLNRAGSGLPITSAAPVVAMDSAARDRFLAAYRLDDKEAVKYIAPPIMPERDQYIRSISSGRGTITSTSVIFRYTNGQPMLSTSGGSSGLPLSILLQLMLQIQPNNIDVPQALMSAPISGDWIFRPEATPADKAAGLQVALSKATGKNLKVEQLSADRDVVVVSGTYNFKPLEDSPPSPPAIHLFLDARDTTQQPVRSTSLQSLTSLMTSYTGTTFINEIQMPPTSPIIQFVMHNSFMQARASGAMSGAQIQKLLDLLTQQTGLEFKTTQRKMDVWKISEQ